MKIIALVSIVVGVLLVTFLLSVFTYHVAKKQSNVGTKIVQLTLIIFSACTGLFWLWTISYILGRSSRSNDRA